MNFRWHWPYAPCSRFCSSIASIGRGPGVDGDGGGLVGGVYRSDLILPTSACDRTELLWRSSNLRKLRRDRAAADDGAWYDLARLPVPEGGAPPRSDRLFRAGQRRSDCARVFSPSTASGGNHRTRRGHIGILRKAGRVFPVL